MSMSNSVFRLKKQASETPGGQPELVSGLRKASQTSPERILQRLEWQVIRRLDGLLQGDYRSLFYGYGVDFADLREYQPGDDIRYIDWNVTARMSSPYVRQYHEDREINAWFLLDLSPSMDFGTLQKDKRSMLIDFVGTISRLLTRHGNRVGAIYSPASRVGLKSSDLHPFTTSTILARGGRIQVLNLINNLINQPLLTKAPFTDLTPLLKSGLLTIKRRSLIFILSDFISLPGWEGPLNFLSRHHEVIAVRLWDAREVEMPDIGPIYMEDAETGEQLYVDTHDRNFRRRFHEVAQVRESAMREAFKHARVDALSLSTEDDLVQAIVQFARQRARHLAGQRSGTVSAVRQGGTVHSGEDRINQTKTQIR